MIARETKLKGAWLIEVEPFTDDRGSFSRTFCQREFAELGLNTAIAQCNTSFNTRAGTLRGMHYQVAPSAEAKLVRCTSGAIFDAIVDMRKDSPTYLEWTSAELSSDNRSALYVPEGFAHGFQALIDDTEVFYQMSEFYSTEHARGFHWSDPRIAIKWPLEPTKISAQDNALEAYRPSTDD